MTFIKQKSRKHPTMSTLHYTSQSIECQGCARSVTAALKSLAGVADVSVEVAAKRVTVEFDERAVSESQILAASEEAGFPSDG